MIVKELSEIVFKSKAPISRVIIRDLGDNDLIYARRFESPVYSFKCNLPKGEYRVITDTNEQVTVTAINKPFYYKKIKLPPPIKRGFKTQSRIKNFVKREGKKGSPASINVRSGTVITNDYFDNLPKYAKAFILAHEEGHLLYKSEEHCDLYALKKILESGGNFSPCFVTLERVLKRNPLNTMRLKSLINNGKIIN